MEQTPFYIERDRKTERASDSFGLKFSLCQVYKYSRKHTLEWLKQFLNVWFKPCRKWQSLTCMVRRLFNKIIYIEFYLNIVYGSIADGIVANVLNCDIELLSRYYDLSLGKLEPSGINSRRFDMPLKPINQIILKNGGNTKGTLGNVKYLWLNVYESNVLVILEMVAAFFFLLILLFALSLSFLRPFFFVCSFIRSFFFVPSSSMLLHLLLLFLLLLLLLLLLLGLLSFCFFFMMNLYLEFLLLLINIVLTLYIHQPIKYLGK